MARIFSKMSFSAILVFVILASRPALASLEGERITHLFEKQADSVVLIAVSQKNHQENKLGSGFVVSEDGLIVTNAHLVSQADQIVVKLRNNRAYRNVRIIGADAEKDIALLKVNAQGLKAVKLGNSKKVEIGQRVVTIGNPLGLESTVSDGLISSVREGEPGFKIFQTSVPLSQGSSGGPLFDLKGKVVGITTASLLKGQNLNFAIPINYVKPLLRRVRRETAQVKGSARHSHKESARRNIPRSTTPLAWEESIAAKFYTVQTGDTLYGVAKKFEQSVEQLQNWNRLTSPTLRVGQRLRVRE